MCIDNALSCILQVKASVSYKVYDMRHTKSSSLMWRSILVTYVTLNPCNICHTKFLSPVAHQIHVNFVIFGTCHLCHTWIIRDQCTLCHNRSTSTDVLHQINNTSTVPSPCHVCDTGSVSHQIYFQHICMTPNPFHSYCTRFRVSCVTSEPWHPHSHFTPRQTIVKYFWWKSCTSGTVHHFNFFRQKN